MDVYSAANSVQSLGLVGCIGFRTPFTAKAFVVTQRHNRDHEVDIKQLIDNVYKPPDRVRV